ncbi:hypothetical protein TIFTF001_019059 [Ficus carica]|uniref:Uncharacterized protein n=1 Tax=Ficus carica TaxID=3494 RepID=A0AA88ACA4_FICCA|nr:hypothetical protein TIFTF001_019059 [Ficus carica]
MKTPVVPAGDGGDDDDDDDDDDDVLYGSSDECVNGSCRGELHDE